MSKRGAITRIRTLYAVFIGVIGACILLFFLNVFTTSEPLELAKLMENRGDYGIIITDLQSSPELYRHDFDVEGLPEGLDAKAKVSRFDVGVTATSQGALASGKAMWCQWLQLFCVLAALAMTVLVVMALVSFYIYVRRGKVFPRRNITWLTWAGALMIAVSLGMDISTYLERTLALDLLKDSQWVPSAVAEVHVTRILFGLTIIFLAEIFKIGREIQEEQELTI